MNRSQQMFLKDNGQQGRAAFYKAALAVILALLLALTPGLAFATAGEAEQGAGSQESELAVVVDTKAEATQEATDSQLAATDEAAETSGESASSEPSATDEPSIAATAEGAIEANAEGEGGGDEGGEIDGDAIRLENAYKEFLAANPGVNNVNKTDYDKAIIVHEYLLAKADFDASSTKDSALDILDNLGSTLQVKVSSKSFQAAFRELMTRLGVPTSDIKNVSANGHAWTLINLDGNWTHIDTANDDLYAGKGQGVYLFFGLTDTQIRLVHPTYNQGTNPAATNTANNYYARTHNMAGFEQAENLAGVIKDKYSSMTNGGTFTSPIPSGDNANIQKLISQQVATCLNGATIVSDANTRVTVEISGANYKITITKLNVVKKEWFLTVADQRYTGDSVRAILRVHGYVSSDFKEGVGYTVSYRSKTNPNEVYGSSGPYRAGTYDVIITGKGNYTGTITLTFKITPASITSTMKTITSRVKYTGKPLTPLITLKYGNYTLTTNDFDVKYSNNVEPGYAKVTVTGKGNFTGSETVTFLIEKDSTSSSTKPGNNSSSSNNNSSSNITTNGTTDSVNNGATNVTTQALPKAPTVTGTWKKSGGKWWFSYDTKTKSAQKKAYPTNQWVKIKGKLYHFDSKGWMHTNWQKFSNKWYYLGSDGAMKTGWKKAKSKWYYMASDGVMQTGKKIISGKTYYLNTSTGAMKTGWNKEGKIWYYYNSSGAMKTGWLKLKGTWYYLARNGAMQTGKYAVSGKTYYFNTSSGAMKTGWNKEGTTWYHYSKSGAMSKGWVKSGRNWYYMDASSGVMKTGWLTVSGKTYFMNPPNGEMLTGWVKINGDGYYFGTSGAMQKNKWVGNYYLESSGKMATNKWIGKFHVDSTGRWDATKK